jgi:hypothetical protein
MQEVCDAMPCRPVDGECERDEEVENHEDAFLEDLEEG